MDISKIIAANLSAWMDGHKTLDTLKKLSAKSGVGFGTVRRAKSGDGNTTIQNLAAIAEAFKRPVTDLLQPLAYASELACTELHSTEPAKLFVIDKAASEPDEDFRKVMHAYDIAGERDKGRMIGLAERILDDFRKRSENKN